jgi:hypothetical protein
MPEDHRDHKARADALLRAVQTIQYLAGNNAGYHTEEARLRNISDYAASAISRDAKTVEQ